MYVPSARPDSFFEVAVVNASIVVQFVPPFELLSSW